MMDDRPTAPRYSRPMPVRAKELIERHGEDYLLEGKRLIRRLGIAASTIGIAVGLAALTIVAVGAYALFLAIG